MNRTIKIFAATILLGLCFTACKKNNTTATTNIKVANMSPDAGSVDVQVNGQLLTGGVGYGSASSFKSTTAGNINLKINVAGSSTTIFNANTSVAENKYYSVYLFDSAFNLKVSIFEDDRTPPPSGKANVRFLHLFVGGPAVDIVRAGGPTKLFTFRSYQDHVGNTALTAYTAIDPGPFSCAAVVSGTNFSVSQLPAFDAAAGKSYTLVLRGFNNAVPLTPEYVKLASVEDL